MCSCTIGFCSINPTHVPPGPGIEPRPQGQGWEAGTLTIARSLHPSLPSPKKYMTGGIWRSTCRAEGIRSNRLYTLQAESNVTSMFQKFPMIDEHPRAPSLWYGSPNKITFAVCDGRHETSITFKEIALFKIATAVKIGMPKTKRKWID